MSERSEPGPTTAPGVGTVSDELLRLRPDLDEHAGCRIMLLRSYDVDAARLPVVADLRLVVDPAESAVFMSYQCL